MEHLDDQRKLTIMVAVIAAMLFAALNQTIIGTVLPRIIAKLGGMEYFSWLFTMYMLTSSVTAILVGKLSDTYGRKPFILLGLCIFIVGSLLAGLSTTIVQLIVYRGIQGCGGGMIMSTAFSAVGDLYAPRERGRWQGLMSAVFGLASVFGPTLGGYVVDHADWHWVFWMFLPFGVVAFILIWLMFPNIDCQDPEPIDYLGSIFLSLTIVPILLAFSWAGTKYAWGSTQILGLLAASLIALAVFVWIEGRVSSPVIPLDLFKNSIFTVSNLVSFTMGAGMFGAIIYIPFFVQGVIGTSPTVSGFVTMPMMLSMVVASALSGQWVTKSGKYKKLALGGLLVMFAGLISMSFMDTASTNVVAGVNMLIVGLGLGVSFPIITLTAQNAVDQKLLGVATGSSQLFRQLGGTVGVSLMGTIMTHRMAQEMERLVAVSGLAGIPSSSPQFEKISSLQNPQALMDPDKLREIQASLPTSLHDLFATLVTTLREALSYSLSGVFLTGALVVLLAFVFTLFLKEIPLRSRSETKEGSGVRLTELREQVNNP